MKVYITNLELVNSPFLVKLIDTEQTDHEPFELSKNYDIFFSKEKALEDAEKLLKKEQLKNELEIRKLLEKNKVIDLKLKSCRERKKLYTERI